jgi:hypothetical protein
VVAVLDILYKSGGKMVGANFFRPHGGVLNEQNFMYTIWHDASCIQFNVEKINGDIKTAFVRHTSL